MIGSRLLSVMRTVSGVTGRAFSTTAKRSSGHGPILYRQNPQAERKFVIAAEVFGGFMWWWIFWHVMTDYEHLIGHFAFPCPEKWTNEQLGIPPDDEEDPEFKSNTVLA